VEPSVSPLRGRERRKKREKKEREEKVAKWSTDEVGTDESKRTKPD